MKHITFDIETTGLKAWFGDIVTCICAKDSEGKKFEKYIKYKEEETKMLLDFMDWVSERKDYTLISKNGKGFDVPFIMTRLALALDIYEGHYVLLERPHIDIQEITKRWISLDDMATILGCGLKSGNGLSAILLWKDQNYIELVNYCARDVEVTEQVYFKLKEVGALN